MLVREKDDDVLQDFAGEFRPRGGDRLRVGRELATIWMPQAARVDLADIQYSAFLCSLFDNGPDWTLDANVPQRRSPSNGGKRDQRRHCPSIRPESISLRWNDRMLFDLAQV